MPTKLEIIGGKPLFGEMPVEVNKNAVLPVLCATILTKKDCVLHNVPKSPDVLKILQALEEMGAQYYWRKPKEATLVINCGSLKNKAVSNCVADIQSAILFVGPLLARFGEANVPVAIGCKLGRRGPEDLLHYLDILDVKTTADQDEKRLFFSINKKKFMSEEIIQSSIETITRHSTLEKKAVTATENLLMALSFVTKFDMKVDGIAEEPHVRFLTKILKEMGMNISGEGSILYVKGSFGPLKGFECDFAYEPDYIDFYGHAVTVALTRGNVFLKCYVTYAIKHMVGFLKNVGISCVICENGVRIQGNRSSFIFSPGTSKITEDVYKLNPRMWPGFPPDSIPAAMALFSQHGQNRKVVIDNWMYENALSYAPDLEKMGARIEIFDTHYGYQMAEIFSLPQSPNEEILLFDDQNTFIEGVGVIEGTRSLISYALQKEGKTIIKSIDPLLRRSPDFYAKLQNIGADIKIID